MSLFTHLIRWTHRLNRLCYLIAGWLCLLLVLLVVQQVLARYLFNASSVGLQELQWHLFGLIFLLSAAHTLRRDEHVRVDLIYSRLSHRSKLIIDLLGLLLFVLPVSAIIFWYGISFVLSALSFTNNRPDDYYISAWFAVDGLSYQILAPFEAFLRRYFLVGETSSDPGGLEARWLIKSGIPICFLLLFLEALGLSLEKMLRLLGREDLLPRAFKNEAQ